MMSRLYILALLFIASGTALALAPGGAPSTTKAPQFSLTDTDGKVHSLADYKGKTIVLEWTNPNCPFVVRHYEKGGMQTLQRDYTAKGVVWLGLNSTHEGHKDFLANAELKDRYTAWEAAMTAVLVDKDGTVGREFGAKTTPHIFIIDSDMNVVYAGAVDDDPRGSNPVEERTIYVRQVLDALLAGQPAPLSSTKPYGCSVKYGS